MKRVLIFGGNGYVGQSAARYILDNYAGITVTCLSRSGTGRIQVRDLEYVAADAMAPETYESLMSAETGVIVSLGSPPVPTFNEEAYKQQIKANGLTCQTIIETAGKSGVNRIGLVSANMPQWVPTGYREGKEIAFQAAKKFAAQEGNDACVVQPAAISGTRYNGDRAIPLWLFLQPISAVLSGMERVGVTGALESTIPFLKNSFSPFVTVEQVAKGVSDGVLSKESKGKGLTVLSNADLRAL